MPSIDLSEFWYKAMLAAGVALGVAAVAAKHNSLLIIGIGFVFWGIGEWINHPYQERILSRGSVVTGKISGHPWNPTVLGICLDAVGVGLLVVGVWRIIFA